MQLEFFGAAGEVTGSCHILRVAGRQLLLDCGLIQGGADAPRRNRQPFPFDPRNIDAVVLSHAHIDHCGRLPLLVKGGYTGPVYTNAACADLVPILLRDSAQLAMRDAERASRHQPPGDRPEPLFDLEDVERTLRLLRPLSYDEQHGLLPGVTVRLRDAGHIMGSSSVELWAEENGVRRKIVFSGDLGQYGTPILKDPWKFDSAELVLMESTYGDRHHRGRDDTERELGAILAQAARDGGNVLVPAFAIGRSQELLYLLAKNYAAWQVGRWGIFLDSPMAIAASQVYWKHRDRHDDDTARLRESFRGLPPLPNLTLCQTSEDSRAINNVRAGAIIIAGSGMANGGRILHHLRHNLERPECHVVIVGFQAPGTLGRQLVDRAPEVFIHGRRVRCASQIHTIGGLSAHGDQADLLRWYDSFQPPPPVFLVHGEVKASEALAGRIRERGAQATVASPGLTLDLADLEPISREREDQENVDK
jgi:metallo-beta-lactamase family protein